MTKLDWHPKRFAEGDIEGEAALRLLGKPRLGRVATLVRETAQNSWDARLPSAEGIDYRIDLRTIRGDGLQVLRNNVFGERGRGTGLKELLRKKSVRALEISDRGTTGLNGTVRVDKPTAEGEPTNFRDFVFALGATHDTGGNGGTYGFGKVISYLMSNVRTVLIWSRCQSGSRTESRFIASAMGSKFVMNDRQYTGRQWWGTRTDDDRVEPLRGPEADNIAEAVFQSRFGPGETGTSLLLLAPELDQDEAQAIRGLQDAILWHLWPKLVPATDGGRQAMQLTLLRDGEPVEVPDPREHEFLNGFVASLQAVRWAQSSPRNRRGEKPDDAFTSVDPIVRFSQEVGHLAVTKRPSGGSSAESIEALDNTSGVQHVALMRHDAELVVTYLKLAAPLTPDLNACGVFRCTKSNDTAFANAEPPAHDTWEPSFLEDKTEASVVRVALRRIKENWENSIGLNAGIPSDGAESPEGLGNLALHLGFLVDGLEGSGGGPGPGSSGTTPVGNKRPRARLGTPSLTAIGEGRVRIALPFSIEGSSGPASVEASLGIGYDGGTDRETGDQAEVVGFLPGDGDSKTLEGLTPGSRTQELHAGDRQVVIVEAAATVAIDVNLTVHEHDGSGGVHTGRPQ